MEVNSGIRYRAFVAGLLLMFCTILMASPKERPIFDASKMRALKANYMEDHTVVSAERYFAGIDAAIVAALDSERPLSEIVDQLSSLASLDGKSLGSQYTLQPISVGASQVYFGNYRVDFAGPSSIRVFDKVDGHFKAIFLFMPCSLTADLEEPTSLAYWAVKGDRIAFAAYCGGSTSGFFPPASLFAWTYDRSTMRVENQLKILHKNGLQVMPIENSVFRLVIRWCHYDEEAHTCEPFNENWYDTQQAFKLVASYQVTPIEIH